MIDRYELSYGYLVMNLNVLANGLLPLRMLLTSSAFTCVQLSAIVAVSFRCPNCCSRHPIASQTGRALTTSGGVGFALA